MDMSTSDSERLHRIQKTVFGMLKDRGYAVTDDEINMTKQQFIDYYGENVNREVLNMTKTKPNTSNQIMVFFLRHEEARQDITVPQIRNCVQMMRNQGISRAILVVDTSLTSAARGAIEVAASARLIIEVFKDAELMFNVTEHMYVPEHQVLTDAEKEALLARYAVRVTQLPRILTNDPVARYYGLQRGQVVKIIRPSKTAGTYVTYRYVDLPPDEVPADVEN